MLTECELHFNDMEKIIEYEMDQLNKDSEKMEFDNRNHLNEIENFKNERIYLDAEIAKFKKEVQQFISRVDYIKSKLSKMKDTSTDTIIKEEIEEILGLMIFSEHIDVDKDVILLCGTAQFKKLLYYWTINY
jgi:hypothetical protein